MKTLDSISDPARKLKKHTWFGGVLTLSLIAVGVIIFSKEMATYKRIEVTKNMFLDPSLEQEKVQVTMAIDFFAAPCGMLSLDIHDSLNHHVGDVPMNKQKLNTRTMDLTPFEKFSDPQQNLADVIKDIQEGIGCSVEGSFELDKVEGNFHFSFHSEMHTYWSLKSLYHDEFDRVNMSYDLKTLMFGRKDMPFELPILQKLAEDLNLSQELFQNFIDFKPTKVDHFTAAFWMEIIPYQLIDHRTGFSYRSYQNSFNMKIKELLGRDREETVPNLEFNYKFSALSAKYSVFPNTYHHVLGTILILLGGIYMFFNVINKFALEVLRLKLSDDS